MVIIGYHHVLIGFDGTIPGIEDLCRVGDQIAFLGCDTFEAAKRLVGS
jgi:hypothetical protein